MQNTPDRAFTPGMDYLNKTNSKTNNMRTIIFFLLLLPFSVFSQSQDVFVKLTDASGLLIKGDAVTRGYEGTIKAFTINSAGKNNTQVNFTMSISGASATLKKTMTTGSFLLNGLITVLEPSTGNYAPKPAYTITMEKIKVISCSESMGCNGVMTTSVIIQAARTGWTYYQRVRDGSWVLASKYGYDAETGAEWKGF
jgi:type VI protein secretion system component Hcp